MNLIRHVLGPSLALSLLLPALLLPGASRADTVSIGSTGCNYIGFQFMLDELANRSGPHVIKLRAQTFAVPNGLTLNTANTSYTFIGGYANCSDASPTPGQRSVLDAGGGNDGTAFAINGTSSSSTPHITLRNLLIRGGSAETGAFANPEGGGLEIRGRVYVRLDDGTAIEDNASGKGGGVYLRGDNESERAVLHMVGASFVGYNDASAGSNSSGGGIHCEDHATVFLDDGQVSANTTDNFSAGIYLKNRCVLDSLIPSNGFAGVLYNEGAAITSSGPVGISLVGRSSAPVYIVGNRRALFLTNSDSERSEAELRSVVIADNGGSQHRTVSLLGNVSLSMEPRAGERTCTYFGVPHGACSAIVGNETPYNLFSLQDWFGRAPSVDMRRTLISGNQAEQLFARFDDEVQSQLTVENTLIVDNSLAPGSFLPALFASFGVTGTQPWRLRYNTISGNTVDGGIANVLDMRADPIELTGSLIHNPGFSVGGSSGPVSHGGCLLVHAASLFVGSPYIVANPALGTDLGPSQVSAALDRCSAAGAPATDFRGNPRAVDQAAVSNLYGPVDLGAIERTQDGAGTTELFSDGFE